MKTKVLSSCLALLLMATAADAQRGGAQIRGGVNLANVSINDDGEVSESNTLTSFQIGVLTDIKLLSILYIQPGVVFSGKGAEVEGNFLGTAYTASVRPYYIEVPVNALIKLPLSNNSSFNVHAGPYVAVGVGGKREIESALFNAERKIEFSNDDPFTSGEEGAGYGILRRFDYGLNAGLGLEGRSLVLSAAYGIGLAKLQSGTNSSANEAGKHRVLSFTVGFKL